MSFLAKGVVRIYMNMLTNRSGNDSRRVFLGDVLDVHTTARASDEGWAAGGSVVEDGDVELLFGCSALSEHDLSLDSYKLSLAVFLVL